MFSMLPLDVDPHVDASRRGMPRASSIAPPRATSRRGVPHWGGPNPCNPSEGACAGRRVAVFCAVLLSTSGACTAVAVHVQLDELVELGCLAVSSVSLSARVRPSARGAELGMAVEVDGLKLLPREDGPADLEVTSEVEC